MLLFNLLKNIMCYKYPSMSTGPYITFFGLHFYPICGYTTLNITSYPVSEHLPCSQCCHCEQHCEELPPL